MCRFASVHIVGDFTYRRMYIGLYVQDSPVRNVTDDIYIFPVSNSTCGELVVCNLVIEDTFCDVGEWTTT